MPEREGFRLRFDAPRMSADSEEAEVLLYGDIIPNLSKYYAEQYPQDKSAADFDRAIKEARNKGARRLLLRINSPGGIVTQAVAMRAILTGAGFESVRVRIEGLCASAATLIACIPGAQVSITPGSMYMIHNPWSLCVGGAADMEHEAEHLRKIEQSSRSFYAAKTGKEDAQLKSWMDAETWFAAEEAVKEGFCDEMAPEQPEAAACVTGEAMAVMRALYRRVPEGVREETPRETVSMGSPAGAPAEIYDKEEQTQMNEKDKNPEMQAADPALLEQVRAEAVAAERQRLEDIDALTLPGYEAMAAQAKKDGTSAAEFQKAVVAAQKAKGGAFLDARREETRGAAQVAGGAPAQGASEEDELAAFGKEIAMYASTGAGANTGMY